jgi:hypothetical protein
MERQEYLIAFFDEVKRIFGMDISKSKKGVSFALNSLRKKQTIQESIGILEKEKKLIRIK